MKMQRKCEKSSHLCEKALSFTDIPISVFKNLPSCNLRIFLGYLDWKDGASDLSEVLAYGLDLKKNLGIHLFNRDTQGKFSNYTKKNFPNTSIGQSVKERTILFLNNFYNNILLRIYIVPNLVLPCFETILVPNLA